MDSLARYYTEEIISKVLVHGISIPSPKVVVDLGIGKGSLTQEAHKKWGDALYFGTDVDVLQIQDTTKRLPFVKVVEACGLKGDIDKKLRITVGSVDVAICNPPYLKIGNSKRNSFLELLKSVGFSNCEDLKFLTSELVFLAQNLFLLKEGGELGIILPDGLLTNKEFLLFRKDLIQSHTLKMIIELPDNIFRKADAKTHILIVEKGKSTKSQDRVTLYKSNLIGEFIDTIRVQSNVLIERMDYSFHKLSHLNAQANTKTLEELGVTIQRGQLTHDELKKKGIQFVHTTNLKHLKKIRLKNLKHTPRKIHSSKNDILLARVGRGCIGKVSYVLAGKALISDCIYKIQVPKEHLEKVWKALSSKEGQDWLKGTAHGVCARVTSKSDLLKFPVPLE